MGCLSGDCWATIMAMTGEVARRDSVGQTTRRRGEMADELIITVNGRQHTVQATADTPLLYVLRNELGLNGPRFGCGLEQCGACMVLRGAEAVTSCMLPVGEVAGSQIITLEGLGTTDDLHPVQRAFLEEQAAQCGYCS